MIELDGGECPHPAFLLALFFSLDVGPTMDNM